MTNKPTTLREEFEEYIDSRARFDHIKEEDLDLIADFFLSHNTELVRKIEGMRKKIGGDTYCITCGGHLGAGECDCMGFNQALDEVISLIKQE